MQMMKYGLIALVVMAMMLPAMPSQAANNRAKKQPLIERINSSMEKSRRVRENKAKLREMKKRSAEQQQQRKLLQQDNPPSQPVQAPEPQP